MTSPDPAPTPLLTIGHGTSDRRALADRLRAAGVSTLVDVRRFPGSRHNPDVGREALESWLPDEGVKYVWEERLGGRRRLAADAPPVDGWWQVESFRAYAAYTRTSEFDDAMRTLLRRVNEEIVAVMCSENVWWRCHRRLIADSAVLIHSVPVVHLMPDGRQQNHEPAPGACVSKDGSLVYPASEKAAVLLGGACGD